MEARSRHNLPYTPEWIARAIDHWIARKNRRQNSEYQTTSRNIYILPTKSGWLYLLTILAILIGAINYNNSLAYMLCFFLSSLGFIAMMMTHQNLNRLNIVSRTGQPVFAGKHARFHFIIQASNNEMHNSIQTSEHCFNVQSSEHIDFYTTTPTHTRGKIAAPRFKLYTEYPLGLFHAWTQVNLVNNIIVYPSPVVYPLAFHESNDQQQHTYATRGDQEFAGIREFTHGDSPKILAWKTIARTGQLYSKEFQNEAGHSVMFNFEQIDSTRDLEMKLSILCSLVLQAEQKQLRYGLELPGTIISPGSGEKHREHCLAALAMYQ